MHILEERSNLMKRSLRACECAVVHQGFFFFTSWALVNGSKVHVHLTGPETFMVSKPNQPFGQSIRQLPLTEFHMHPAYLAGSKTHTHARTHASPRTELALTLMTAAPSPSL